MRQGGQHGQCSPAEKRQANLDIASLPCWCTSAAHESVPGSRKSTKSHRQLAIFHRQPPFKITSGIEKVCTRPALVFCTATVSRRCGKRCSALQRVGTSPKTQKEREKICPFNFHYHTLFHRGTQHVGHATPSPPHVQLVYCWWRDAVHLAEDLAARLAGCKQLNVRGM